MRAVSKIPEKKIVAVVLLILLILPLSACGMNDSSYSGGYQAQMSGSLNSGADASGADALSSYDAVDTSSLYVIEEINPTDETVTVKNLTEDSLFRYNYSLATEFLDKYGNFMPLSSLSCGEVVVLGDKLDGGALKSIQLSDKVERFDDVNEFSFDRDKNIFSFYGDNYRLSDETQVFSDNTLIDITAVTETDTLSLITLGTDLVSIIVTTGHGYIAITNTSTFDNSLIEIGDRIKELINGNMTIEVPAGQYSVTVASNGYGGTTDVTVTAGETVTLNLETMKGDGPKTSQITFLSPSSGIEAKIYLDGQEIAFDTPNTVTYGRHRLRISAEGYEDWNKTLFVNSPSAEISLDLSSSEENSSKTSSSTASGSTSGSTAASNGSVNRTLNNLANEILNGSGAENSSGNNTDYLSTLSDLLNSINLGKSSSE